ncbi:hypothetical protein G7K_0456-t1 [Saitoella complicata NRRL Y-17804]|uniref:Uncharacterized protein n=1 Tax=Saitoella complicata (strain BCRC 22490 / CBS 7301 / JCM 7358 / NBRC 10748 / NRRL Y-17804) TaxID=698492 RepID=A0A0E9N929_SAICN|nr:hypothetical protein G7K_0456-t1 [Saitoella complicata NRRL Y-17804]
MTSSLNMSSNHQSASVSPADPLPFLARSGAVIQSILYETLAPMSHGIKWGPIHPYTTLEESSTYYLFQSHQRRELLSSP